MKKLLTASLLAVTAAAVPSAAVAQMKGEQQVGSRFIRKPRVADEERTAEYKWGFQHCYYGSYNEAADRFLAASDPMTDELVEGTIDTRTFRPTRWTTGCEYANDPTVFKSQISFSVATFRYMMAEEAYTSRFPSSPPAHMAVDEDAIAPDWGVSRRYVTTGDLLGKARFYGDFADCIVAKDPLGADTLIRTMPATSEERSAAMAMVPALGACLMDGYELELTPANIRSFAADGLWQRYVANPVEGSAE